VGVSITGGATASGNAIQGNYIGTTADGSLPLPNAGAAWSSPRPPATRSAGRWPRARNVITGQRRGRASWSPGRGHRQRDPGQLRGADGLGLARRRSASRAIRSASSSMPGRPPRRSAAPRPPAPGTSSRALHGPDPGHRIVQQRDPGQHHRPGLHRGDPAGRTQATNGGLVIQDGSTNNTVGGTAARPGT
jgi:hypothetical protein